MGRPRRMTAKVKAMLAAYVGEARLNLSEAARMAGYRRPEREGYQVKERWREEFAKAEEQFRKTLTMGSEELDEKITQLARNPRHKDHYKALELLCRLHGKLSEKVHITLDRPTLNSQLDSLVALMVQSRSKQTVEVALLPEQTEQPAATGEEPQPS